MDNNDYNYNNFLDEIKQFFVNEFKSKLIEKFDLITQYFFPKLRSQNVKQKIFNKIEKKDIRNYSFIEQSLNLDEKSNDFISNLLGENYFNNNENNNKKNNNEIKNEDNIENDNNIDNEDNENEDIINTNININNENNNIIINNDLIGQENNEEYIESEIKDELNNSFDSNNSIDINNKKYYKNENHIPKKTKDYKIDNDSILKMKDIESRYVNKCLKYFSLEILNNIKNFMENNNIVINYLKNENSIISKVREYLDKE